MARSLLKEGGLPNQFWAEAVATSVYLLNLSPTKAVPNQTPYEAWTRRRPTVSHLRVFGCIGYALIPSSLHQKLDSKSVKCILMGYSSESKAYKLYNPITCKVIVSRDVVFNESERWNWSQGNDGNGDSQLKIPLTIEGEAATPIEMIPNTTDSHTSRSSNNTSHASSSSPGGRRAPAHDARCPENSAHASNISPIGAADQGPSTRPSPTEDAGPR